jgi:uncharacterized protein (TIGR02246 family)
MNTTQTTTVQSVFDQYVDAVKASNAETLLSLYADDVHVYDLMAPFERHGKESSRELIEAWLNDGGQQDCSIEDLEVIEEGDLASARASIRYGYTGEDGTKHTMWNRGTWTLRRIDGEWKIIVEHTSVPLSEPEMQPVFDARGM